MAKSEYKIEDGPNKYDLLVSLFEDKDRPVTFSLCSSKNGKTSLETVRVVITGLSRRSPGSTDEWDFHGFIRHGTSLTPCGKIEGRYSVRNRGGSADKMAWGRTQNS